MFKKSFNELLKQEVSRKEFLQYLGAAALAVTGVVGLKDAVLDPANSPVKKRAKVEGAKGYSSGPYGR